MEIAYKWRPIEPPKNPNSLAVSELRAFEKLWHRQKERLKNNNAINDFNERMARWWSIETGIIEKLYDISDGITIALVEKGFHASLIAHGEASLPPEELIQLLDDHRNALTFVMDIVGGAREFTTGWIKELQALFTRNQRFAKGRDMFGNLIDIPLAKGKYKNKPNNPMTREGRGLHEYCPPEQVSSEMDRLVDIYLSIPDIPEVRSAWLHHAFSQIHPFQDGNGRVARALASIDFIKAGLFPVLVKRNERDIYLNALQKADYGDLSILVQYFARVQQLMLIQAISVAEEVVSSQEQLATILASARQKRAKRKAEEKNTTKTLYKRTSLLLDRAESIMDELRNVIRKNVPGVKVQGVERCSNEKRHWFRQQLIDLGNKYGYWVDLVEPRDWVRLQLRDGGVTDIVVASHFIGNPSPGAVIFVAFVEHRDKRERVGTRAPMDIAAEPLLLVYEENTKHQQERFLKWLDQARVQALAQWTRFL